MHTLQLNIDDSIYDKVMFFLQNISPNDIDIQEVQDSNLKEDSYFYERKAHIDNTIEAIENGSMKTYDSREWDLEMSDLEEEINSLDAN